MWTWPAKEAEWRSAHSEARMQDVRRSSATPTDAALNAAVGCGGRAKTFEPAEVRYIKLGENGKWAASAVEDGVIPFGYPAVDHQVVSQRRLGPGGRGRRHDFRDRLPRCRPCAAHHVDAR